MDDKGVQVPQVLVTSAIRRLGSLLHSAAQELRTRSEFCLIATQMTHGHLVLTS